MRHFIYPKRWPLNLLSAPFIFGMLIPIVILDITMELYHRVSFPLYGIPYVKRSYYIVLDRHKLKYLDFFMKLGCAYCGYVNGVLNYAVAVAGETEKYWCGIMHSSGKALHHQKDFLPYADREAYRKYVADARIKSGTQRNGQKESMIFIISVVIIIITFLLLK